MCVCVWRALWLLQPACDKVSSCLVAAHSECPAGMLLISLAEGTLVQATLRRCVQVWGSVAVERAPGCWIFG